MRKYLASFQVLLKLFIRTISFPLLFIGGIFGSLAWLFYTLVHSQAFGNPRAPISFFELLQGSLPIIGLVHFIVYAILALELSKYVIGQGKDAIYKMHKHSFSIVAVSLLFLLILLWFIAIVAGLLGMMIYARSIRLSMDEIANAMLFFSLALGGPSLVGLLLGALFALSVKRTTGYGFLLFVLILISPLAPNIISNLFFGVLQYTPRLFLYQALIAPFDLSVLRTLTVLDTVYLLPHELYRWLLLVVWAIAAIIGITFAIRGKKRIGILASATLFLMLIGAWSVYDVSVAAPMFSFAPYDISDASLRNALNTQPPQYYSTDIPEVSQYRMQFSFDANLSGRVTMVLSHPFAGTPEFTLFKGYRVSKITDASGRDLNFFQQGNYLTITDVAAAPLEEYVFYYSGSGWGDYANQQGVFLPGTFPYYPWPGKQQFYRYDDAVLKMSTSPYVGREGSVDHIEVEITGAPFSKVYTQSAVITLPMKHSATISGSSLTLLAGQVQRIGDSDTFYCVGGKQSIMQMSQSASERQEAIRQAIKLREEMGIKSPNALTCRYIVFVPTFPRFSNIYDIPIYQDDQIFVQDSISPNIQQLSAILALQSIPQEYTKRDVYVGLFHYLLDPKDFLSMNPGAPNEGSTDIGAIRDPAIANAVRKNGEEKTLRRIVAFLSDPHTDVTNVQFLASLG